MSTSKNQGPSGCPSPMGTSGRLLLVPECGSSEELAQFAATLGGILASAPPEVTLRFVGLHEMGPDQALVIQDVLRQKSPGTCLVTEAWSSLLNGSALVWLMGDRRRIRPTAWLYFRKVEPTQTEEEDQPLIQALFGHRTGSDLREIDHKTVLRLASQHLPIERLIGIPITAHILAEYCLLDGQSLGDGDAAAVIVEPLRPTLAAPRAAPIEQPGERQQTPSPDV